MAVRKLLLLLLFVLACAATALAQGAPDRELLGLKGPVKTVRTKNVNVAQGEARPAGPSTFAYDHTFDMQGRKVEERFYKPDGSLWRREVYTYDGVGGRTDSRYKPDGTLEHQSARREVFDKARGTGRVFFTGPGGALRTEFRNRYDSQGRQVEGSVYDPDGKLTSRSVWRYGADGALKEFVQYDGVGSVLQRSVRVPEGFRSFVYGKDGTLQSTELRGPYVCEESDAYGNCKRMVTARTITKGGKVEESTDITFWSFTYY